MDNITFLMPCRIESDDRLKNIITSISYICRHFPKANILVKENDKQSVFKEKVIPAITTIFGYFPDTIRHIFEESENDFFYKTRILNDMLIEAKTDVVFNYDVDVVYPVSSYITAYEMLENGFDAVYPYGCGIYQYAVNFPLEVCREFIQSDFNLETLVPHQYLKPSVMGWGQMIKKDVYVRSYMWNENFISWGAEDCEYYYRLNCLGYRVGRVNDVVYHFEHARTFNSHYHNPKFLDNHNLWQNIRTWDKDTLERYYESQKYVKERRGQLNASV